MLALDTEALKVLFLAGFLAAAVVVDVRTHRIPNALCLSALLVGLAMQLLAAGLDGMLAGLAGIATGLAVLAPLYLIGGMGAGDVKLMAAVGAYLGASDALLAGVVTLLTGAAIGGGVVAWDRMHAWVVARGLPRVSGGSATAGAWAMQFPYAAAIAVGAAAALLPLERLVPALAH